MLEPNFKGLCKQFGLLIVFFEKIEENANFRNSADNILEDDKFPSMQRVNKFCVFATQLEF